MQMPTVSEVLDQIRKARGEEKTASAPAATPAPKEDAVSKLASAVEAPVATPAPAAPAESLEKMAADLVATENEAQLKFAYQLGAAFMDGAVARSQVYEGLAKTASVQPGLTTPAQAFPNADPVYTKIASEYPEIAQVYTVNPQYAVSLYEKQAAEDFAQGYEDAVNAIASATVDSFRKGAAVIDAAIANARNAAGK